MKLYCWISVLIIFGSGEAYAQQACSDHPVLETYESVRDDSVPRMDALGPAEKDLLKAVYQTLEGAAIDGASHAAGNPIPVELLTNAGNFRKIIQGDVLGGALGIYGGIIGKLSPTLGEALPNMWRDTIASLSGVGPSYGEREDRKNREQASRALESSGCPGEIGLPQYVAPTPSAGPHYKVVDYCGSLNLGLGWLPEFARDSNVENGTCAAWFIEFHDDGSGHVKAGVHLEARVFIHDSAGMAADDYEHRKQLIETIRPSEYRDPYSQHAFGWSMENVFFSSVYLDGNAVITISGDSSQDPDHDGIAEPLLGADIVPMLKGIVAQIFSRSRSLDSGE